MSLDFALILPEFLLKVLSDFTEIFNNLLLKALRASAYVKDPLANLARWNATHPHQK